jgi:hypothetical protein
MKNIIAINSILVAGAMLTYATFITPYNTSKPANMPLPTAYAYAMSYLGSATNQFHCLSAKITTDYGADGEWQFTFYSTNAQPKHKWVTVEFNGKIHIEDVMNR